MLRTRFASPLSGLTAIISVLLLSVATPPSVSAQTPTADQIEAFQNMTPEQQQAIMEAMGSGGSSRSRESGVRTDRRLDFPETVRPRARDRGDEESDNVTSFSPDGTVERKPRFKGGDTVLL